ncbi:MAG TPA: cysteine rich repeat-containing protein [Afifellaceae bacterium]|nr:cysteine rich repeat-containing protein [Afifellaceae bacterium]
MRTVCAAGLLAALFAMLPGMTHAAGLMAACKTEITANCADVTKGRGRISACLMAYQDRLSGGCRGEVAKVRNSRIFQRYVPGGFESLPSWGRNAGLRQACASDVSKYCSRVKVGDGRLLACLYARSSSVSKTCSSQARTIALQ